MKWITNAKSVSLCALTLIGCASGTDEVETSSNTGPTWEEFLAGTYHENFEGGHYIVNGDTPIVDEKALHEFYDSLQQGGLIVNTVGGADDKWNDTQKLNITYCISDSFGSNKAAVVSAFQEATDSGWETMGNVNFVHLSEHDGNCTARAFFPSNGRSSRNVLIDSTAFGNTGWPLAHIVGHELGHTLGFRHEHTRPEAATCFEDNNWRPLTPYDSASIMHYPQCNGSSSDLDWTATDAQGVAALYGAPGGNPPPPPPPGGGTPQTDTASGSVAANQWVQYQALSALAGTTFTVTMTGTGDPDLYVRFGAAPTTASYSCRPYLDGANEQCSITVPSGQSSAFIGVRGYTSGTFTLNVAWTAP